MILSGKPGRGKTHIAVAVAYKAIQNGFDASSSRHPISSTNSTLPPAMALRAATAAYVEQPRVLVIDEVGYLQCASDAANVLYGVVDQRCLKRRPIVFTTNKALKRWGEVLHDAEARRGPPRPRSRARPAHPTRRTLFPDTRSRSENPSTATSPRHLHKSTILIAIAPTDSIGSTAIHLSFPASTRALSSTRQTFWTIPARLSRRHSTESR
ncbi:MAG: ATP-binding protein [Myxococcales bacterium]|nr:ATP-binding protein [Myxococcales bacterium]